MTFHNKTTPKAKKCFVCNISINYAPTDFNKKTNLPVCKKCIGTEEEIKAEKEALDTLSEGFVCGCI